MKYFSQEFDNKVLDIVKQNRLYPCEYVSDFEKLQEKKCSLNVCFEMLNKKLSSKGKFYSLLTDRKISNK